MTFNDAGTWVLPQIGTDWIKGFDDMYLLINPVFSIGGRIAYYTRNKEITTDFFKAGILPGEKVRRKLFLYNDGIMMVAVPLTLTALTALMAIEANEGTEYDMFSNTLLCYVPDSVPAL